MTPKPPQTGKLPDHVKRILEARGLMDPYTGATRRARAWHCETCRQPIMRGINRDFGGLSVDCDPQPLDAAGELTAIITGRKTYDLRWLGDRYQLDQRDAYHIQNSPPGTAGIDVLAVHDHNAPIPSTAAASTIGPVKPADLPINPPF